MTLPEKKVKLSTGDEITIKKLSFGAKLELVTSQDKVGLMASLRYCISEEEFDKLYEIDSTTEDMELLLGAFNELNTEKKESDVEKKDG